MIIGFKGEKSALKKLYSELDVKGISVESIEALDEFVKKTDGKEVVLNYNELVVADNVTADIVEKRTKLFKTIQSSKNKILLELTGINNELDKIRPDVFICTKVDTKDTILIQNIFLAMNSDLPYNDKLNDDQFAVKFVNKERAEVMSLSQIKEQVF